MYPLEEVLRLCLLAMLAGVEASTEIADFGTKKLDFLRRFHPFRDGTSLAIFPGGRCVTSSEPCKVAIIER